MQTDKTTDSCFILPVLPHKIGNVRDFWDDVSEKFRDETEDHMKGVGIKRMLAFLQAMPEKGDFLILFIQSADDLGKTLDIKLEKKKKRGNLLEDLKDLVSPRRV